MKKEVSSLLSMARKILDRRVFFKIKKLKDLKEKRDLLKYSLKNKLVLDLEKLNEIITGLEKKEADVFLVKLNADKLGTKINYFLKSHSKRDFNNILKLKKIIKKELKNV